MKKLILPALLFSLAAEAQIVFTKDDFPSATDTSVTYGSDATSIPLGSTGGGQNWDFSNLHLVSSAYSSSWVPKPSTPGFLSDFPTANLVTNGIEILGNGQLRADSTFAYMQVSDTYADFMGTYTGDLSTAEYKLKYNTPQRVATLPFGYQNSLTSSASGTVKYGAQDYTIYRTTTSTMVYDAYGKIRFPGSTESVDGARFKDTEFTRDSMVMDLGDGMSSKSIIHYDYTNYTFSAKNGKGVHIMYSKMTTTTTMVIPGSPFPMEPITDVKYDTTVTYDSPITKQGIVSSLDSEFENAGLYNVYPSVTTGKISLSDPGKATAVKIYALNGEELPSTSDLTNINIEGLPGIYVVKVNYITGKQKSFKVVKQ